MHPRIKLPHWKPWYEHCETPYDLGMAHGKEDRAAGYNWHLHSGCVMSKEEFEDYHNGYGDGWHSEHNPLEFR